jgi:SlyX protein
MITDKKKMIDLETRLAFQEDTLNALNDIVTQQQLQIDRLEKTSKSLVDRIRNLSTIMNSGDEYVDEKPPHY